MITPNSDVIVNDVWPLDGSAATPEHLLEAARAVRELVRYANHTTLEHSVKTLPYVGDVSDIVGALVTATSGLAQLFHQLNERVQDHVGTAGLRHDRGEDPNDALLSAVTHLAAAEGTAHSMSDALAKAQTYLARIAHTIDDEVVNA